MGSAAEGQDSRAPACQDSMSWKLAPNMQKRKQPSWPWPQPCDLKVNMGCWPCPYLPMTLIWSRLKIIKAVKTVKFAKIVKNRKWTLWPWPCDLEVNIGCWPCPNLAMTLIWSKLKIIKAVKTEVCKNYQKTEKTFVTLTLTLWPWGQQRRWTLSIPTYDQNMSKIEVHWGCQKPFSKFDLGHQLSDLEGKKIKIPLPAFFAYGHKEHICAFLALSHKNCKRR